MMPRSAIATGAADFIEPIGRLVERIAEVSRSKQALRRPPAIEQLFSVTDSDVGRPIADFTDKLAYDGVERDAGKVLRDLLPTETEVKTSDKRWLMMRMRPYRSVDDKIEGVVLSFVDISARRQTEERLRESEARNRRLFDSMDEGYLLAEVIRDEAGQPIDVKYADANPAALRLFKADVRGRCLSEIADVRPGLVEASASGPRDGRAATRGTLRRTAGELVRDRRHQVPGHH